ncbi:MAG: hypothetical protein ACXIVO_01940 [Glycocaulis sp.]
MPHQRIKKTHTVLYISNNDGSDTRISKEIRTISKKYNIIFLGIGSEISPFISKHLMGYRLARGRHNSPLAILKLLANVIFIRLTHKIHSAHIINEQLMTAIYPSLIGMHIVLDIFDSIFLKLNAPNNKMFIWKAIIYGTSNSIIVTDGFRLKLIPHFAQKKAYVIPNVPLKQKFESYNKNTRESIVIAYFGTLREDRGTSVAQRLLSHHPDIILLCAGWATDEQSIELIKHPQVRWLGAIPQDEANSIIAREANYILAIYPTSNLNNYYASPNKLYDAIHTRTPLICSDNIKVSDFIVDNNLGIAVGNEILNDGLALGIILKKCKNDFNIDAGMAEQYSWENFEKTLEDLHARPTARPQGQG